MKTLFGVLASERFSSDELCGKCHISEILYVHLLYKTFQRPLAEKNGIGTYCCKRRIHCTAGLYIVISEDFDFLSRNHAMFSQNFIR